MVKKDLGILIITILIGATFSIVPHANASFNFSIDILASQYTSYNIGDTPEFWALPINTGTETIPAYDLRGDYTVIAPSGARINAGYGWNGVPIPSEGARIIINTDEPWTIPSGAEDGLYHLEVVIQSQSTGLTRTKTVLNAFSVQAPPPPDFDISIEPGNRIINQGDSTTFTVTITALNFWTDPVTLSASLLPDDVDWSFDTGTGTPTFSSTLSITTYAYSTPGNFPFTVIGEGGGKRHTAPATLIIQEVIPPFDFSLNPSVSEIIVAKGRTSEPINVQVNLESGTAERVDFVLEGLEDMGAYSFSPLFGTPDFNTELTIGLLGNVPLGIYDLTIKGVGGGNIHSETLTLEIVDNIVLDDVERIALRNEFRLINGGWDVPDSEIRLIIWEIITPLNKLTKIVTPIEDYVAHIIIDVFIILRDRNGDGIIDQDELNDNIADKIHDDSMDMILKNYIKNIHFPWADVSINGGALITPQLDLFMTTTLSAQAAIATEILVAVVGVTFVTFAVTAIVPLGAPQLNSLAVSSSTTTNPEFLELFSISGIKTIDEEYNVVSTSVGTTGLIQVNSLGPVDLEITDQLGRTVNKNTNEIPGADYHEADSDGDGELDDAISLPDLPGMEYTLYVTPELGASQTDTFTVIIGDEEKGLSLLDFYEISRISEEGYKIVNENAIGLARDVHFDSEEDNDVSANNGQIQFNMSMYSLPTDIQKPDGSYSLDFSPDSGYEFVRWERSDGISVSNQNSQSTTMTVSGDGTLTAIYCASVPDTGTLSITTTPVSGTVIVNGESWGTAPQSRVVDVGSYTVSFGAVTDYTTPASQTAAVTADTTTTITGTYTRMDARWWDTDWTRKQEISVTEQSGHNLINYPANITIDTASEINQGEMKSDCSDIRVINETSMRELEFSILQPDTTNTIVTVKLNLTASATTNDIFLYYGNPAASSVSSSFNDAYYEFWDDFEQSNLGDKWDSDNGVDAGYTILSDGFMKQYTASGQWHYTNAWTKQSFIRTQGWQIEFDFYNTNGNAYARIFFGDENFVGREFYEGILETNVIKSYTQYYASYPQRFTTYDSSGQYIHHHSWDLGSGWFSQRIIYDYSNGELSFWLNGVYVGTFSTDNLLSGANTDWKFGHVLQGGWTSLQPVLDNVKIRAWIDVEPTTSLGSELSIGEGYSLTVSVEGSGSTDPTPGTYTYSDGAQVQVDALPDSGWSLSHWLLDGVNVGDANPYTVTMNNDNTLTAVFVEIPPGTGTLSITTTPVSGTVIVNGESWGTAPQSRVVDVGSYTVSFGAVTDYTTPASQTAAVTADTTTTITGTYVAIPPDTGTLSITTTPVSGTVYVDGESWGTAPQSRVVDVGSYTVSFGAVTDYTTPASQTAAVTADTTTTITGTYALIPPDTGTLSITTAPVSGTVIVNGVSWGVAPQSRVVDVGSYTVSFMDVEGYTTPASQTAAVTVDTTTTITGTYTPPVRELELNSIYYASLYPGGDVDHYMVNATPGDYSFETFSSIDTYLTLYGTDRETVITSDDDSGEGLNARITWTCTASGWYYLRVRGYSGYVTGTYSILWADVAGAPPDLTLSSPEIDGLSVEVNGIVMPGSEGPRISRIHWDWGDESSEDHWFPASHTYAQSGTYTITVTTHQSDGLSTSISVELLLNVEEEDGNAREMTLFEGWNFIGLPLTPEDPGIEVVLANILDNVESVWAFDGATETWSSYSPGAPSSLVEMGEGRGYWILLTGDATLMVRGESVDTSELALFEGWNLIGLPLTPVDSSIGVVLTDILDNVESVWTFNGATETWSSYSPGAPSNLAEMIEDRGYWIKVNTDCILTLYP